MHGRETRRLEAEKIRLEFIQSKRVTIASQPAISLLKKPLQSKKPSS
jgi:hypothetical protein